MLNINSLNKYDSKWVSGWKGLPEFWIKLNVPSVTKIIGEMIPDPEMEDWARKIGEEKAKEILTQAGYRGTAMHTFIEQFMKTFYKTKDAAEALKFTQIESPVILEKENIPAHKINEGRELFYKFYYSQFPSNYSDLIGMELGIYSTTLFYRGLLDVFYRDRVFGPAVTDFKTMNDYIKKGSVKELKYKCQLGGYAAALDEMYLEKNITIKRSSILCVSTKSEILQEIVCEGKELEEYKEKFKSLVQEWHISHNQSYLINNQI